MKIKLKLVSSPHFFFNGNDISYEKDNNDSNQKFYSTGTFKKNSFDE